MAGLGEARADAGAGNSVLRDYQFLAAGALAVCGMVLYFDRPGVWWALVPVLIGLVGVLLGWSAAPGLYLVTLAGALVYHARMYPVVVFPEQRPSPLPTVLLAAASLTYVAAQMRVLTLMRHGVPPDPRRHLRPPGQRVRGRWFLPAPPAGRSAARVGAGEMAGLLAGAVVFAVVAFLLLTRLTVEDSPQPNLLPAEWWQIALVLWAAGVGVAAAYAFLSYLGRANASPEESALYLQDQLWTATRGEQRRINRWLTWARLGRQQKEETP
jgi:hypothetical protein